MLQTFLSKTRAAAEFAIFRASAHANPRYVTLKVGPLAVRKKLVLFSGFCYYAVV
jgi:hypothetical protein